MRSILFSRNRTQYFLCVCADGFQGFSKAFHYPIQLLPFICFFEIILTNFANATEFSRNSFLCDWSMFSSDDLSLAAGKIHKN